MKRWPLILILLVFNVFADTSVWKISHGNQHLFLGGTVHVLSQQDYPLPPAYDKAYQQSSRVIFESDISKINDPAFQRTLVDTFAYDQGKTLHADLRADTIITLEQYCADVGIPITSLLPFKPQFIALMLTSLELQKLGISIDGVDQYYNQRALRDNKPIDELETLEQQIHFIQNMGRGQEDELILSTIKENQQLGELMPAMLRAWRSGDNATLNQRILKPMQDEFPSIYQDLLVRRNQNWLPLITHYLSTPETEFVLVGVLHLVGNDGLLELLKNKGYQISQQ